MRWASIDGALLCSGVAIWEGEDLRAITTLDLRERTDASPFVAWREVLGGCRGIIRESGFIGRGGAASIKIAEARGRIDGYAEALGCELWTPLNPSQWRRTVGITPGGTRRAQKRAALAQARWLATDPGVRPSGGYWDRFHLPALEGCTDDEAEAVLIGLAWIRMSEAG